MLAHKPEYASLAVSMMCLGGYLMMAPKSWFGPTWSYFATHGQIIIPAGGFGMGLCLTGLGILQLIALWRAAWGLVSTLFFLSGFVFWTSGLLLTAEGLLDHRGIPVEAPLMLFVGGHKVVMSVKARSGGS